MRAGRAKAASAAGAGRGPGAGKRGSWQDEEGSEPWSGPMLPVLARLGQFMPSSNKYY